MKKVKSIGAIIVGVMFILGSIVSSWLIESATVIGALESKELFDNYEDVESEFISASNDGKLIATNGPINKKELYDNSYDVDVESQILIRYVEMYQWVEKTDLNDKVYYEKEWSSEYIDSNQFEIIEDHQNPIMREESQKYFANDIRLGSYLLSKEQLDLIEANVTYTDLSEEIAKDYGCTIFGNYYLFSENKDVEVGDVRISFKYSDAEKMSAMGVQKGDTLESYVKSDKNNVFIIKSGVLSGRELLYSRYNKDMIVGYIARIVAIITCFVGALLIYKKKAIKSLLLTIIMLLVSPTIIWNQYSFIYSIVMFSIMLLSLIILMSINKKSKKI